ncbi:MAG TPA: response regulator [bacterium]|nr:response regulator transcription factor [Candidatus Omnitrophota bacterium]HOJ59324.1 response regulator [bacterium]HOL94329.1 response regulator [bacterium]HPP00145.1 response regulator [bacterium]HXK95127.1 response regulator [bacterium]
MKKNGVFRGKKIFLISDDQAVLRNVQDCVLPHDGVLFYAEAPREALGNAMAKNPDLIIYDDRMPTYNGSKVMMLLKYARPSTRILLLSLTKTPQRAIDTSAQGITYSIHRESSARHIYNAIKHCLGIASVPRVETTVPE